MKTVSPTIVIGEVFTATKSIQLFAILTHGLLQDFSNPYLHVGFLVNLRMLLTKFCNILVSSLPCLTSGHIHVVTHARYLEHVVDFHLVSFTSLIDDMTAVARLITGSTKITAIHFSPQIRLLQQHHQPFQEEKQTTIQHQLHTGVCHIRRAFSFWQLLLVLSQILP